jgi:hypothetical protein
MMKGKANAFPFICFYGGNPMSFEIELPESVTDALGPDVFDVLDFVAGAATPTDEVTIYTDADAAHKLNKVLTAEKAAAVAREEKRNKKRRGNKQVDDLSIADDYEESELDEAQVSDLYARLEESALVFTLRGIAPKLLTAIDNEKIAKHNHKANDNEDTAYFEDYNNTVTAKSIVSVRKKGGAVSTTVWTPESVEALKAELHFTQWSALFSGVVDVNYNAALFQNAVTPDFS